MLHLDKTCTDIVVFMVMKIKTIIFRQIILNENKLSISVKESTTLDMKTILTVVIQTFF